MIRLFIGEPKVTGKEGAWRVSLFPYRIDGHWGPGGAPLVGIAEDPVLEACRVLHGLGVSLKRTIDVYRSSDNLHLYAALPIGIALQRAPPAKALPAPQRRPRKRVMQVRGSGVPGDG